MGILQKFKDVLDNKKSVSSRQAVQVADGPLLHVDSYKGPVVLSKEVDGDQDSVNVRLKDCLAFFKKREALEEGGIEIGVE